MKTWEMIKEVMENPKKRFVCHPHKIEVGYHDSFLVWFDGLYTKFYIIRPDEEWTEVKQSVTWQEALEAWSKGKTIECIHDDITFIYKPIENDNGDTYFVEKYGDPLTLKKLTKGTWYIEN